MKPVREPLNYNNSITSSLILGFIHLSCFLFLVLFCFGWWVWGLNSGLYTSRAGTLLVEPHHQAIYSGYFED
jgi:hypothetical protein